MQFDALTTSEELRSALALDKMTRRRGVAPRVSASLRRLPLILLILLSASLLAAADDAQPDVTAQVCAFPVCVMTLPASCATKRARGKSEREAFLIPCVALVTRARPLFTAALHL